MIKRNYLGEIISGKKIFEDDSFGYYDENGVEHVNWQKENDDIDSDGFDKRYIDNGGYKIDIILPKGKTIARYGNIRGRLTTDVESNYEELGLPYVKKSIEYHRYRVVADGLKVECRVIKGKVAPMFNSKGGAIQYKHYQSIANEIEDKKLEEVFFYE